MNLKKYIRLMIFVAVLALSNFITFQATRDITRMDRRESIFRFGKAFVDDDGSQVISDWGMLGHEVTIYTRIYNYLFPGGGFNFNEYQKIGNGDMSPMNSGGERRFRFWNK